MRDREDVADLCQIVHVIIAIASFYYPNPDVATSNGLEGAASQSAAVPLDLYEQLLALPVA